VEAVTAALFAVITVVTVLWPDWIERLTAVEPDAGSGSAEWGLVLASGAVAIIVATLARRDYLRWRLGRQDTAPASSS
jgi:hypothetical protein